METNKRMEALLSYLNIDAAKFAKQIGKERPQAIYDVLNGKTKNISNALCSQILSVFPQINKVWLLTGAGAMIAANNNDVNKDVVDKFSDKDVRYLIDKVIEQAEEIGKLRQQLAAMSDKAQ